MTDREVNERDVVADAETAIWTQIATDAQLLEAMKTGRRVWTEGQRNKAAAFVERSPELARSLMVPNAVDAAKQRECDAQILAEFHAAAGLKGMP